MRICEDCGDPVDTLPTGGGEILCSECAVFLVDLEQVTLSTYRDTFKPLRVIDDVTFGYVDSDAD